MASLLSNLVDNIAEGIHKINVKMQRLRLFFFNMKVSMTI